MFWIHANHTHHSLAVDDLTLVTHFLYGSTNFHLINLNLFCSKPIWLSLITISNSAAVQVVG